MKGLKIFFSLILFAMLPASATVEDLLLRQDDRS